METTELYAKKTFLALKNPYHSVIDVHPGILDQLSEYRKLGKEVWYTGYKNTVVLSEHLKRRMAAQGFLFHTKDRMALGGRAIDLNLVNPLNGHWMTGSSSGTALNVFYGINDAGIGTDGGGSVLAPAAALNLFGFISPLIEQEDLKQYEKKSTDDILFYPSVGAVTREWDTMKAAAEALLFPEEAAGWENRNKTESVTFINREDTEVPNIYGERGPLIQYLRKQVKPGVVLISKEGPVDGEGFGDSVFGHFDVRTAKCQEDAAKGLMRVVNMSGKSALVIPEKELGVGTLLICESTKEDIAAMILAAESMVKESSELVKRYFLNYNMYF